MSNSDSIGNPVLFERNKSFLGGAGNAGIIISAPIDADIQTSLIQDRPFPARRISLGDINLEGSVGKDIVFGKGPGKVAFSAKASAFSGLGVFPDPAAMLEGLRPDENIAPVIHFPKDNEHHYMMLRWGYGLAGAAKGSIALGAGGGVTFGADGRKEGVFAVIRRLPRNRGARTSVAEIVNSWMLPRQVAEIDHLDPGTWILSEVDGSIAAQIGVQYGMDFNWVREAKKAGLQGDIGLRLQLGLQAALGFHASGRYAIVLSRDSLDSRDKILRLRLYKLNKNGWSFGFNLGASAQADTGSFLSGKADDFIKAVFGVHGAQIVDTLRELKKWTDPDLTLPGSLAGLSSKYVQKLMKDVTGIDPSAAFDSCRNKLLDLLDKWDALDHETATLLWKYIDDKTGGIAQIRDVAELLTIDNPADIKTALGKRLEDVEFFRTPAGEWLESLAGQGLASMVMHLEESGEFAGIREKAGLVSTILDKDETEKLLGNLKAAVEKRLNLDKVLKIVRETDFNKLDAWLQLKLSEFLDESLDFEKIEKIRDTINLLIEKRQDFYEKALKALNRKYEANIAYAYQRCTTKTALFDIEFDFAGNSDVSGLLRAAVNGNFNTVLTRPDPGVKLNTAELSHGIRRQSTVELSIPYSKMFQSNITGSLAGISAIDDESGRVLLYELEAGNETKSILSGKIARNSTLAVAGSWPVGLGNGVTRHNENAISYTYSFRQAKLDMRVDELKHQLGPYVAKYLPGYFSEGSGSFGNWLHNLDYQIEQLEHNGIDNFGDTLFGLDLSLPGEVAAAWANAPEKGSKLYGEMSRNLQAMLKQLIPFYYFSNPAKYRDLQAAASLLVYASLPAVSNARIKGDKLTFNGGKATYWDWMDKEIRTRMISDPLTRYRLKARMRDIHELLMDIPGMHETAAYYEPIDMCCTAIIRDSLKNIGKANLKSLLYVEASVVDKAVRAGVKMARFRKNRTSKPTLAIATLSEFGEEITRAFNEKITGLYGGESLRPLGTLAFIEASKSLSRIKSIRDTAHGALLYLAVLKEDSSFNLESYIDGKLPEGKDLVVEERLARIT